MTDKIKLLGIELTRKEGNGRNENTWYGMVLSFSCFLCGLFGCAGVFLNAFPVACSHTILYLGILAIGVFYIVVWLMRKYRRLIFLLIFPAGAFLYYCYEDIIEGLVLILRTIQSIIIYQDNTYRIAVTLEEENKIIFGFLFIAFLWAGVLWIGTLLWCIRTLTALCVGTILAGVLLVGDIPVFWASCLMLYCCLGNFTGLNGEGNRALYKGAALTLAAGFLLLSAGYYLTAPYLRPLFDDKEGLKTKIQRSAVLRELSEHLPKWGSPFATGGIANGDLGRVDGISYTFQTALRVSTDEKPEETIYLRGYTGAEYTGTRWNIVEDEYDPIVENIIYTDKEMWLGGFYEESPSRMNIERVYASPRYRYRPYLSASDGESGNDQYAYSYIPREWLADMRLYDNDVVEEYQDFVRENYLSYPEERLPRLLAQCRENPRDSFEEIREYIVTSLSSMADYNLLAGRFPPGEDFTEYFLYEARQGYCTHFATAAVLMFRMYGVPARYVEGYIAPANDFKEEEGQYTADIKDSRAHAWVEVYTEKNGWMPVETTPGYSSGGDQPSNGDILDLGETPETESGQNVPETAASETSAAENGGIKTEKTSEGSKINITIWPYLLGTAAILLILFTFLRRWWILKKRSKKSVKEIFRDMYQVLQTGGLKDDVDCQEPAFPAYAAGEFHWLEEEMFTKVMDLVLQANFGKAEITTEETEFVRKCYRDACAHVGENMSRFKRFLFRYWKVYY